MMRFMWMLMVAMVAGLAAGCVPERVAWSPDGTKGAIMGDEGLAVCDSTGKLTKVWVRDVHGVGWMPDSKRLVVVRDVELKTWRELAAVFPKEAEAAKGRAGVVRDALLHAGRAEDVMDFPNKLKLDSVDCALTIIYLRDTEAATFKLVPTAVFKQIINTTVGTGVAQVYDVSDGTAKAGAAVMYFMYPHAFFEVRVSPTGRAVAITKGRFNDAENTEFSDVFVAATDGTKSVKIEQCAFPDWTPDGQQLIYVRQTGTVGNGRMGLVGYRNIESAKGVVLDDAVFQGENVMGAMAYHAASRVRVAKGGVVYFVGMPLSLPAMGLETEQKETLFWIDPKAQGKFKALPANWQGTLNEADDTLAFFEVSPDGKLLSIPYKDGRVKLIEVATGNSYFVQPTVMAEGGALGLGMVPVWRTSDELTFLRPRADGKGSEVVSFSVGQKKGMVISGGWGEAVRDWLGETAK